MSKKFIFNQILLITTSFLAFGMEAGDIGPTGSTTDNGPWLTGPTGFCQQNIHRTLLRASLDSDEKMVIQLLSEGANPNIQDSGEFTPYINLLTHQKLKLEHTLAEQANTIYKFKSSNSKPAYFEARMAIASYRYTLNELNSIKTLIDIFYLETDFDIALPYAIVKSLEYFKVLIYYRNISIDQEFTKDQKIITPLIFAIDKNKFDIAKFLVADGANINYQCPNTGLTALIIASQAGDYRIAKMLLYNGANPSLMDNDKKNAVYYAAKKGNQRLVDLLIWGWLLEKN